MTKTILAVDDERHIARLVQVNLERAGFRVALAYDGVEALEKVAAIKPDMIVCDVMMPRLDGLAVLQRLKSDVSTRDIPVIMLTAKSQDPDVLKGWMGGVDCYLTKPFNPMELLSFVRRIFASQESVETRRYVV